MLTHRCPLCGTDPNVTDWDGACFPSCDRPDVPDPRHVGPDEDPDWCDEAELRRARWGHD